MTCKSTSTKDSFSTFYEKARDRAIWFLVAGLFVLRIPFLGGLRYFTWTSTSYWVMPIFEVGTYLLTAILIWLERDRLSDHHIDRLALFILVFGKPVELLWSILVFDKPVELLWLRFTGTIGGGRYLVSEAYLLYLPISVGLLVGMSLARPKPTKFSSTKWQWVGIGALIGMLVGALSGWLSQFDYNPLRSQLTLNTLMLLARSLGATLALLPSQLTLNTLMPLPVQEMLYAGIAEEPFFRGFLWGVLRRSGWKDGWVLIVQGMLFWLAHIYWIERSPVTFWVIVPLGGLIFGVLAWRSRSIGVSMIAHGLVNGVLKMVLAYRF